MAVIRDIAGAYRTLGLEMGATLPEAKTAYRHLIFSLHPDRNSSSTAHVMASAANVAFDEIKWHLENGPVISTWSQEAEAARQQRNQQHEQRRQETHQRKRNVRNDNPLRAKVLEYFEVSERAGKKQADIIRGVMELFDITHPNAYYYWNRVYKKK